MKPSEGLYTPDFEHDACGVGFVANVDGAASHAIVERGVEILQSLLHRGATGADRNTGDGAGVLLQIPDDFLRAEFAVRGVELPDARRYGLGMFFLPRDKEERSRCCRVVEEVVTREGLPFLGWRDVPTDDSVLGAKARAECPAVMQCAVDGGDASEADLERKLYIARREVSRAVAKSCGAEDLMYIVSFSCRVVVYKGLMMATQVPGFYADLRDERLASAMAVVHQRYSTNTFPSWELAQPFRYLAHNGEINTLRGNLNQMRTRESYLESELFGEDIKKVLPVIEPGGSDSACLDNAVELLVNGGRDLAHAMMMLVPQAWGMKYPIGPDLRGFFEYHSGLMEPWDGPAALAFSDGHQVGALLDRNGLRPARYTITSDGFMYLASEAGVLDVPGDRIKEKGALRPGEMILVDLDKQRVIKDNEIKMVYARRQPYRRWVEENKITLHGLFNDVAPVQPQKESLRQRQRLFGYTREDLQTILDPMASHGHEPVGSMGCDAPLAVLSEQPQLLFNYFKQLFAQVTNPAIDPIREELVMSLMTFMGNPPNILSEVPGNARLVKFQQPILSNEDLERVRSLHVHDFRAVTLNIGFPYGGNGEVLGTCLDHICRSAQGAVETGARIIVLSDRNLSAGEAPVPSLLAVSAVNQHLIRAGLRSSVGLIVETGEAREVQHMALLLGYGATAINPYLAFETVADMSQRKILEVDLPVVKAIENTIASYCKGLLKIMSKMGISTLRSYRSAQVFEAVGLDEGFVDEFFTGTMSRVGGIGLEEIAAEANVRASVARDTDAESLLLPSGGHYTYRYDGERHLWNPGTVHLLQKATRTNDPELFDEYTRLIDDQRDKQYTLRGLLRFRGGRPIPIEDVEPVERIVKRFMVSAMSFGSISREAHENLAIAMSRLGSMSNSGEGGEDPERYKPLPNGDRRSSAIKQVASGRFGVTAEYLVNARELQIKIAQGAKPGEGGQLPGHKVNATIARVRHSTPGVTLISPPPHHDIYSIEDIKQLISDLKNVNTEARVSVKLVSEVGVGTVAAGVVKGGADMVLISGYDGGTGASPLSSIRHAGVSWELGLSETHQTLVRNGLRDAVVVQTDGQIRTGRDVVIAALLGAEEFGFATAPLVVSGCVMLRNCHLNTCSVGVATQDPELRCRFEGRPEYVVHFFHMLAEQVRKLMAELGFRKIADMVGHSEYLEMLPDVTFGKARKVSLQRVLTIPEWGGKHGPRVWSKPEDPENRLDRGLVETCRKALESGERVEVEMPIRNVNRSTATMLSGEVAKRCGNAGLPDDTIVCRFAGSAGQSFGAFCAKGITLYLDGEANDYLGKGLSGGRIVVRPDPRSMFDAGRNVICGNVLLYGATGGEVYIHGRAGERFGIRNSGAQAVVEGVGDHGCEYMTGGRIVVLGETGVNFAAGMSGGIAYVYDPDRRFDGRCNLDMVDLEVLELAEDVTEVRALLERHVEYTGSPRAKGVLADFDAHRSAFVKVFPMEYRRMLGRMSKEDEATEREEVVHG